MEELVDLLLKLIDLESFQGSVQEKWEEYYSAGYIFGQQQAKGCFSKFVANKVDQLQTHNELFYRAFQLGEAIGFGD